MRLNASGGSGKRSVSGPAVVLARASDQAVGSPELVDRERRAAAQQAAGADEADERARGERAAAEAEDVDLVGGREGRLVLVVLDQPVVGRADVGFESEAEAAAGERIERSGADAFEIELELRDACPRRALRSRHSEVSAKWCRTLVESSRLFQVPSRQTASRRISAIVIRLRLHLASSLMERQPHRSSSERSGGSVCTRRALTPCFIGRSLRASL